MGKIEGRIFLCDFRVRIMHGETGAEDSREARPQQTSTDEALAKQSFLHETMCDSAGRTQAEWSVVWCVRDWGGDCPRCVIVSPTGFVAVTATLLLPTMLTLSYIAKAES